MPAGPRICTNCSEKKPLTEFHKHRNSYRSVCKECRSLKAKAYRFRTSTPERREMERLRAQKYRDERPFQAWSNILKSQYGITAEQWDTLLETQNNSCAICFSTEPGRGTRFAVDHDHNCCSGPRSCGDCVRGLLCHNCNLMLGTANDSIESLESGINYLTAWEKKNANR